MRLFTNSRQPFLSLVYMETYFVLSSNNTSYVNRASYISIQFIGKTPYPDYTIPPAALHDPSLTKQQMLSDGKCRRGEIFSVLTVRHLINEVDTLHVDILVKWVDFGFAKLTCRNLLSEQYVQLGKAPRFRFGNTEVNPYGADEGSSCPKESAEFTPMPFGRVQLVGDELADPDLTGVVANSSKDDGECTLAS